MTSAAYGWLRPAAKAAGMSKGETRALADGLDVAQVEREGLAPADFVQEAIGGASRSGAGDAGRAEAAKRFGPQSGNAASVVAIRARRSTGGPGAGGRAEALRRFGRPTGDDAA